VWAATTQLLIRSAETLASGDPDNAIGWVPMGIIAFTVVIKLLLWAYCATVKNSESVEAMMIDNRNDVITNTYGLIMIFFASRYYWWMDPLGAIGMSLYIMFIWYGDLLFGGGRVLSLVHAFSSLAQQPFTSLLLNPPSPPPASLRVYVIGSVPATGT
jgi:hypothetical protein